MLQMSLVFRCLSAEYLSLQIDLPVSLLELKEFQFVKSFRDCITLKNYTMPLYVEASR